MSGILFGRRLEFFGRINLVCSFSGARSWVSDGEKWIVFTIDFQISWIFAQNARKRARNIIEQPFQIYSLINLRNQLFFHRLIHREKNAHFFISREHVKSVRVTNSSFVDEKSKKFEIIFHYFHGHNFFTSPSDWWLNRFSFYTYTFTHAANFR